MTSPRDAVELGEGHEGRYYVSLVKKAPGGAAGASLDAAAEGVSER